MATAKYWMGGNPLSCDICHKPIKNKFYDAKTVHGPWGIMCPSCFPFNGTGVGQGRGQCYEKQADGKFLKTVG